MTNSFESIFTEESYMRRLSMGLATIVMGLAFAGTTNAAEVAGRIRVSLGPFSESKEFRQGDHFTLHLLGASFTVQVEAQGVRLEVDIPGLAHESLFIPVSPVRYSKCVEFGGLSGCIEVEFFVHPASG
jgi:hypothetical protein